MEILNNYQKATDELILCFLKKYFDTDDYRIIGDRRKMGAGVIRINGDFFFDITDIETALMNNIQEDILIDWYYKTTEDGLETNLYNYYLQNVKRKD